MALDEKKRTIIHPEFDSNHVGSDSPAVSEVGNSYDTGDMDRMGKRQELRRSFKFFSLIAFISVLQATWESTLEASYIGLLNGGRAGVIWLTIISWIGFLAMIASMAEMASMAPTAGGQYHWVSEFAPASWQKPASYLVGWTCCLGWVSSIPACAQIVAGLIQGMVLLVNPDSTIGGLWQTALLIWAVMLVAFIFNVFGARFLARAESYLLVLHVVGFLAVTITLWVVPEHVSAKEVFLEFKDGGGWNNMGLSVLVGFGAPLWFFIGPDGGTHVSEEVENAGVDLPRAMMWGVFLNGIIGIVTLITFCFCVYDIDAALNTRTYQPCIYVFYHALGVQSPVPACILTSLLAFIGMGVSITNIAAASRQCWSFARDGGFPFSQWLRKVDPRAAIPLNATLMCAGVSYIMAAVNFGSLTAFYAILDISNATLVFSYIISIGCIWLKRIRNEPLLARRWSLGKWGVWINGFALVFLAIAFVFSFFSPNPLDAENFDADMNWAIVMFAGTGLLAGLYYAVGGHARYVPPVRLVKVE